MHGWYPPPYPPPVMSHTTHPHIHRLGYPLSCVCGSHSSAIITNPITQHKRMHTFSSLVAARARVERSASAWVGGTAALLRRRRSPNLKRTWAVCTVLQVAPASAKLGATAATHWQPEAPLPVAEVARQLVL
jgi:hypothetical protein